jgi:beta-ribofuranosylaminobenzene 5'-phosphate synthase
MLGIKLLEVKTGSRLHFGLFELAEGEPLRYGGLGLMLAEPGWRLRFSTKDPNQQLETVVHDCDPLSANDIRQRIDYVRERVDSFYPHQASIQVDVLQSLPLHSGLGAGTQLAAAVAIGFKSLQSLSNDSTRLLQPPHWSDSVTHCVTISELLNLSGRGKRSSIGLCGILNGGLILDYGLPANFADRSNSPRTVQFERRSFDVPWPILLISAPADAKVAGAIESDLISIAAEHPNPNRQGMLDCAKLALQFSTSDPNYDRFTASLDRFVDYAGALFEPCQGGRFNGAVVQHAVELARYAGLGGVGQSSWGPTVFGFARDMHHAQVAMEQFHQLRPNNLWTIRISHPSNAGASLEWGDRGKAVTVA